jgi:hypothetical protein
MAEDADYEGIRAGFIDYLESSQKPIQMDFGVGDVITTGSS